MAEIGFGFGIKVRTPGFFELACRDGCWVNLISPNQTYTGIIAEYVSRDELLIFGKHVGFIYAPDGRKRLSILSSPLELDLRVFQILEKERASSEEVKARINCYNLELAQKSPYIFWNVAEAAVD